MWDGFTQDPLLVTNQIEWIAYDWILFSSMSDEVSRKLIDDDYEKPNYNKKSNIFFLGPSKFGVIKHAQNF